MKILQVGTIIWRQGNISLDGWHFDVEGEDLTDFQIKRQSMRLAVEVMLDNCQLGIELSDDLDFDAQRMASDAIFAAQVTSSPALMREILPRWWQFWKRWTR